MNPAAHDPAGYRRGRQDRGPRRHGPRPSGSVLKDARENAAPPEPGWVSRSRRAATPSASGRPQGTAGESGQQPMSDPQSPSKDKTYNLITVLQQSLQNI